MAHLYLPGEHNAEAEILLERDPDRAAQLFRRSEFRNILAGYIRRGVLSFQQACVIQREAEEPLAGAEYEVRSLGVLELVRDSGCSACDCEFVAQARSLSVPPVTMDAKLLRAFPESSVALSAAG